MDRRVSIIIVYFKDIENIEKCLLSISKQVYKNVEVILVDNNSQDMVEDLILPFKHFVTYKRLNSNTGFCRGNNIGISLATGEYFLFLNSDTLLDENCIRLFVEDIKTDQGQIISGKILRFDEKTIDSTGLFLSNKFTGIDRGYNEKDLGLYNSKEEVFGCCGAALFTTRRVVNELSVNDQFFNEIFFAFLEDVDLSIRAQLNEIKVIYDPEIIVFHKRGASSTGSNRNVFIKKPILYQYLILRNRYYLIFMSLPISIILSNIIFFIFYEIQIFALCFLKPKLFKIYIDLIRNFLVLLRLRKRAKVDSKYRSYKGKIDWILR